MRLVLLSGGSGKRLWPLSNDSRSKQFLKVLENPQGQLESMVQRVWRQLCQLGLDSRTIVATSRSQLDMLHNQIGTNVPIVTEPERRDTFPAIVLASSFLYSVQNTARDEVIVVLPVDSFVDDRFFANLIELEHLLQHSGDHLALIGVKPTFPSAKYGYIVPSAPKNNFKGFTVSHFVEKPSEDVAEQLIQQGALWNCGVFAFRLGWLLSQLEAQGIPKKYDELKEKYSTLPKISFDYQVVEKAENVAVISYDGTWKDLGTWNTLSEEMDTSLIGKGIISTDSINTHIINELDIPVAVLGVSNAVVAVSPNGILVTDKAASPRLKEVLNFDQRLMYEECPWGWYRVLDYNRYSEELEMLTRRVVIKAGKGLEAHFHRKRQETWTILSGKGVVVFDGVNRNIGTGDVVQIPNNVTHSISARTDLELIEVQTGEELTDNDIWEVPLGTF